METTIDGAGRLVIPKPIREQAGMRPGTQVEISFDGQAVLITVPVVEVGVTKDASGRIVTSLADDDPGPFAIMDDLLAAIDEQRR
ncbi:MAG TPA: AbrB/MazE/SpoVT family DNA-binding domain-containing protein [Acidimicrobiales bacterium]|nr:AbrB/MazE/SpoVT family DNA-binding domain-containing protein [Acidimicrobiales bacterium]